MHAARLGKYRKISMLVLRGGKSFHKKRTVPSLQAGPSALRSNNDAKRIP